MRCPRCHREIGEEAPPSCIACGAPLRLHDEGAPRALDAPVALDRRDGGRIAAGSAGGLSIAAPAPPIEGRPAPSRESELAALDRSHWDLGRPEPPPLPRTSAGATAPRTAASAAAAAALRDEALPDADVDALEIRLRRPETWRRAAAWAIDGLPFLAGGVALARVLVREASTGLLAAPPTGLDGLLDLVARERVIVISIAAAVALALSVYATLAHGLAGATLGKWLLRLRLVGPDGRRPTLSRSAARSALAALSVALLGLGFVLALFTRSGRALHDLAARTWVVEAP